MGIIFIVCNGQNWGCQEDREQPGDEAYQPSLTLGPDQAGTKWKANSIVSGICNVEIIGEDKIATNLSTVIARMVRTEVWDTVSSMKGTNRHIALPITQMS